MMAPLPDMRAVNGHIRPVSTPGERFLSSPAQPLLEKLRRKVAAIENREPRLAGHDGATGLAPGTAQCWQVGLAEVDRHLPGQILAPQAVHEIAASGYGQTPAAMGFAIALVTRLLGARPDDPRPVLWCRHGREVREFGTLYSAGFEALGLARTRLITTSLERSRTALWVLEEALKSATVSAVIADMDSTVCDLTATRRLGLIAAETSVPVLLVAGRPPQQATSARTRWRIAASPSIPPPYDTAAPGLPAWTVELTRCRGGKPGKWSMVWHHATHSFSLASALSHRTADRRLPPERFGAAV